MHQQACGGEPKSDQGRNVLHRQRTEGGIARVPQVADRRDAPQRGLSSRLPHGLGESAAVGERGDADDRPGHRKVVHDVAIDQVVDRQSDG